LIQNKYICDLIFEKNTVTLIKYDKPDQQGKAAFNERKPHTTQQQVSVARSPGDPTKTGQGTDMLITKMINA
jgi:hypothetical protein